LGLNLGANAGVASTIQNTTDENSTTGTDRGSFASASNLGLNLGANAGVASTIQNTTTGVIGS
ncbi:hypothetical protein AB0299_17420, partial [Pseudarthrobacter sp. NPDC080037]|uniref:hypothetical protein n=1 Tax=Pseudarthrobacter sp. NPDC080037 TaxID=3155289 RepID=UPI00344D8711